jgi:hypothetical protein
VELAKLHAALAQPAATARASGSREWAKAAGPGFCDMSLALHDENSTRIR